MRLHLTTVLDAPAARVWDEVQRSRLLDYVAAPLIRFVPANPPSLPAVLCDGQYLVQLLLFGVVPIGSQWIIVSRPSCGSAAEYQLRDNGYGSSVRRWDHLIRVAARGDGRTDYSDTIEIEAGVRTLAVWMFALILFRHRHRRWRRLASTGFGNGERS